MHRERNGSALVSVNPITDTEVDALKAALDNVIVVVLICYCRVIEFYSVGLLKDAHWLVPVVVVVAKVNYQGQLLHQLRQFLHVQFHGKNRVRQGSPNASLTPPDMHTVKYITADANCLFRSLAYVITG